MMLLSGVFFLSINFSTVLWQALLAGMFYGITIAMAIVPLMAMIQSTVKEEMMGRVMSLLMLSSMGFIPLSYAFINRACNRNSNRNRYEKWCNRRYRLRTICSDSCSSCKKV